MNTPTIQQITDRLLDEGRLGDRQQAAIMTALAATETETSRPWFVSALAAISAWVAALLLIVFVVSTALANSDLGLLIVGLLLCGGAAVLGRQASRRIFAGQLALAVGLAGAGMVFIGTYGLAGDSFTAAALALLALEIVLIVFYPDPLHRFLATLAAGTALVVILFDQDVQNLIHILTFLLAAAATLLWEFEAHFSAAGTDDLTRPIGYGLAGGLCALLTLTLFDDLDVRGWWLSALGLLLVLLALEWRILQRNGPGLLTPVALIVMLGSIALLGPAWQTPGILAALLLLVLGFQRSNWLVLGLAIVFLGVFIVVYYFQLQTTLLVKSLALMGSGVLLLGVYGLVHYLVARREAPA